MAKAKQLSKKQLAVIEDMFTGQLDEQAVLDKHNVSRNVYNKWLADADFTEQFNERIASAHRQSSVLIARYAPLAAAKLVQLTESESPETARKACLDIISLPMLSAKRTQQPTESRTANVEQAPHLPPETCSKLLSVLAQAKEKK